MTVDGDDQRNPRKKKKGGEWRGGEGRGVGEVCIAVAGKMQ